MNLSIAFLTRSDLVRSFWKQNSLIFSRSAPSSYRQFNISDLLRFDIIYLLKERLLLNKKIIKCREIIVYLGRYNQLSPCYSGARPPFYLEKK